MAPEEGFDAVDGCLFDLGLSSFQLADTDRGLRVPDRRPARHALRHEPRRAGVGAARDARRGRAARRCSVDTARSRIPDGSRGRSSRPAARHRSRTAEELAALVAARRPRSRPGPAPRPSRDPGLPGAAHRRERGARRPAGGPRRGGGPAPARRPPRRPQLPLARGPHRQALPPGRAPGLHLPARGCPSASAAASRACACSAPKGPVPTRRRDLRQPPRPQRPPARRRADRRLVDLPRPPERNPPTEEGGAPNEQASHRPAGAEPTAGGSTSSTSASNGSPSAAGPAAPGGNPTASGSMRSATSTARAPTSRSASRTDGRVRRGSTPRRGRRSIVRDAAGDAAATDARGRDGRHSGHGGPRDPAGSTVVGRDRPRGDRDRVQRRVPVAEPERPRRRDGLRHRPARSPSTIACRRSSRTSSRTWSGSAVSRPSGSRRSMPASASSARRSASPPASERSSSARSNRFGAPPAAAPDRVRHRGGRARGPARLLAADQARRARRERPPADLLPRRGPQPPRPDLRPQRHDRPRLERHPGPTHRVVGEHGRRRPGRDGRVPHRPARAGRHRERRDGREARRAEAVPGPGPRPDAGALHGDRGGRRGGGDRRDLLRVRRLAKLPPGRRRPQQHARGAPPRVRQPRRRGPVRRRAVLPGRPGGRAARRRGRSRLERRPARRDRAYRRARRARRGHPADDRRRPAARDRAGGHVGAESRTGRRPSQPSCWTRGPARSTPRRPSRRTTRTTTAPIAAEDPSRLRRPGRVRTSTSRARCSR